MSRIEETLKNSAASAIIQFGTTILSFITRTVFIYTLSEEYLGISGLFGNILSMLSLAELGVGTTITYLMYKPMAENDNEKIKILLSVYKKLYNTIGIFILCVGLLIAPFLNIFMKEVPDIPYLTFIFVLYIINMASSYFIIYKSSVINVAQKNYIVNGIKFAFTVIQNIVQIIILLLTHNYILYYLCVIVFSMVGNIAVSLKAEKMFPYIKEDCKGSLTVEEKKQVKKDLFAMFSHSIGGFLVFGTDNLLISKFVGVIEVGLYSNYLIIINAVNSFVGLVFGSLNASVGNLMYSSSKEKSYSIFKNVFFATCWIAGFCSVCLFILANPFITLWIGEKYLFADYVVLFIVINFYLGIIRRPANIFKQSVGLFWNDRFKPYIEAVVNLTASIILLKQIGIAGVFIGTTISTVTVSLWVEPYILYKNYYKKNIIIYFGLLLKYSSVFIISGIILYGVSNIIFAQTTVFNFLIQMCLCIIIPNLAFMLLFWKTEEIKYFKNIMLNLILKLKKRKK